MTRMVVALSSRVKLQVRRLRRTTKDAALMQRCQILLLAHKGRSSRQIAEATGCSRSWASRVLGRFVEEGLAGLNDRREGNGVCKIDEDFLGRLYEIVGGRPTEYGYGRPTWTRELLVAVMARLTGVRVHVGTMSRALRLLGARRGRPRPVVNCPWSKAAKTRRIAAIRDLLARLPRREVAVYADEVDIHLNPKIGYDWMNCGQQKEVLTPGKNQKCYLAGACDAEGRELTVVEGQRKNSALFIALLAALAGRYRRARRIHVILDNFRIHHSQAAQLAVRSYEGRIVLHFLPPYCPNDNRIERVWLDLHAEVTRNHQHPTLGELMNDVWSFVRRRDPSPVAAVRRIAA